MNKFLLLLLCIAPLLIGCGGSDSSSGNSSSKYQWQIVQLKSVSEDSLDATCIIYADSALNEGEVITAYVAEQDYNILYHNQDGSIASEIAADEIADGLLTIDSSDVPDEGYVTLEEISEARGGDTGSYMFSVQKSLLSDLVLSIAQEQTGSCYKGDDYRESLEEVYVNVSQPNTDPDYYQTSYDENSIDGQSTAASIPVGSTYPGTRDILVTAFADYDDTSEQKTGLSHWAFVDSNNLFEEGDTSGGAVVTTIMNDEVEEISWDTNSTISLDDESGVIAVYQDNAYFWQPIYDSEAYLNVAYDSDDISLWSSYFSGTVDDSGWTFARLYSLSELPSQISLSDLNITSGMDAVTVSGNCSVAEAFCIDSNSSFDEGDFAYQRVHLRLTEDDGDVSNISYQSIYSGVNDEPVVLESSLFNFSDPDLTRAEFNLMSSSAGSIDAIQYLMVENIDLVSVGEYSSNSADDDAETALYNDINGYVTTESESDALLQTMLDSDTTLLMNNFQQ